MTFNKIMLVTNEPSDTAGAEATALNLAKRFNASVLLVDSIRTPFNASRCPSISADAIFEAAASSKRAYLNLVRARFEKAGITASTKMLFGPRTSSELISTVVENECDLVIRYLKGQSSRSNGRFGETAENLMRACPVPVLLTETEFVSPKVAACINLDHGREENQAILDNARRLVSSPTDLSVVSCWEFTEHEFLYDYVDEGLDGGTIEEMSEIYGKLFEQMQADYDLDDLDNHVFLFNANPVTAIPKFCREHEIDITAMCSSSLNHPLGRKLGTTIERTIGHLPCGLLTVKPIGFGSLPSQPSQIPTSIGGTY